MEKISWTGRVRNEVLHRDKEERNVLKVIKMREINWIGQILRIKCLIKHVSFVNQFCASSGNSELGRASSGWITSPSLSKFGGS